MSWWLLIGGALLIGYGLLCWFKQDWLWDQHEQAARRSGLRAERTEEWENSTFVSEAVMFIFGTIALAAFFLNALKN